MGIEAEIYRRTGAQFKSIPGDGNFRYFEKNGCKYYALSYDGAGVFGEVYKRGFFMYDGKDCRYIEVEEKAYVSPQQYVEEKKIVAWGNSVQDSGGIMSDEESDRYILALIRVVEFDQNEQRQRGIKQQRNAYGAANGIPHERA